MKTGSELDLNNELLIYASDVELAIKLCRAKDNYDVVVFPQAEMEQLSQLIRKKVLGGECGDEREH